MGIDRREEEDFSVGKKKGQLGLSPSTRSLTWNKDGIANSADVRGVGGEAGAGEAQGSGL